MTRDYRFGDQKRINRENLIAEQRWRNTCRSPPNDSRQRAAKGKSTMSNDSAAAPLHGVVIPRQCKDIPDRPILEFLLSHRGKWCNWYFWRRAGRSFSDAGEHTGEVGFGEDANADSSWCRYWLPVWVPWRF